MFSETMRTKRERVLGCLLGGAVGDALGAPVEFDSITAIRRWYGVDGIQEVPDRGLITDDTQMTLFTLEGMIRAHASGSDAVEAIHSAYLRWLATQNVAVDAKHMTGWLITNRELFASRAPGMTCLSALRATMNGEQLGSPAHKLNDSKGCGGVMRVAPVAMWPGDVFRLAVDAAALTHSHPSGYLSAGVLATIVQQLMEGLDLTGAVEVARGELARWPDHQEQLTLLDKAISLHRPTPETIEAELGGGWVGEEALAIAVCAAFAATDLPDGVRVAVNHSGDSDSTGAICGNILGARDGVQAIPQHWLDRLELRHAIETLADDALLEFSANPDRTTDWFVRYPAN